MKTRCLLFGDDEFFFYLCRNNINMRSYKVGTHVFTLDLPKVFSNVNLAQYSPFLVETDKDPLFELCVSEHNTFRKENYEEIGCFNEEPPFIKVFKKKDGTYLFEFMPMYKEQVAGYLVVSPDFKNGRLYMANTSPTDHLFNINNALMLLYTFNSADKLTLLMHASVTRHEGYGNLFLGKSGTGKSTHSQLWIHNIPGCDLMNDDNPVVEIVEDKVYVFGSPWSGKTPCYRNVKAPVRSFVRLVQAPANHIYRMPVLEAYMAFRMSSSCMKWDRLMADGINKTIDRILQMVPCYHLDCLPDKEAVFLCRETVEQAVCES